MAASNS